MSGSGSKNGWAGAQVSEEQMRKFVARYKEMPFCENAYVDTLMPGYEREICNVIGPGPTENPQAAALRPQLPKVDGFHLGYIRTQPGTRGALHAHDTVEIFIPIFGTMVFMWGDNEEHEFELNVGDVITVPAGVYRCFRNDGPTESLMIGMVSSTKEKPAGRIAWPDLVFDQVRKIGPEVGIAISAEGDLIFA